MGGCCHSQPSVEDLTQELNIQHQTPPQESEIKREELKKYDVVGGVWPFTDFFFSDLQSATKNFSSDEIVSENDGGGESSNVVYRGQFQNLGFIAVKRLKAPAWADPDIFAEDARRVGGLKHKRVVNLLGYCCDGEERLLVSEFMPNDTLAKRLFHQKGQAMEWPMRMRVALCVAEALDYCSSAGLTAYSNLSAYSVLFDENGDACLSCFGLVKEIYHEERAAGSVDPESVIFRFGTILLKMITGKQIPPSHAPEMINGKDAVELMDPRLKGKFSVVDAMILFDLVTKCLQPETSLSTKDLVAELEDLQTEIEAPSFEMDEISKNQEEASSSSLRQQLVASQTKPEEVPFSEMAEKHEEDASSFSQQGQLEASQTKPEEAPSSEMAEKQEEEASSSSQQGQTEASQNTAEVPSEEKKEEADPSKLSPLGDACLRKDLDAIHEFLLKSQIEDDKKVLECSLEDWLPMTSVLETVREMADDAFKKKKFETAIDFYTKVAEGRNVVVPSVYARRCLSYLYEDKVTLAHLDVIDLQDKYPNWSTGFYLMSLVLAKADMPDDSAEMLQKATLLEQKS
ncbi:unnamed protein product [Microthlaspi erraticum]|uniref:Serine/threonine-protein kinase BSK n=1 Tax=Microthlaspi erraticum TaxID=1685480 RepID=A0A6D2I9J4_9BRAS|nr:unnamed protein product [Microthlaspi erraticum]